MVDITKNRFHKVFPNLSDKDLLEQSELIYLVNLKEHLIALIKKDDDAFKKGGIEAIPELLPIAIAAIDAVKDKKNFPITYPGKGQMNTKAIVEYLDLYKFIC